MKKRWKRKRVRKRKNVLPRKCPEGEIVYGDDFNVFFFRINSRDQKEIMSHLQRLAERGLRSLRARKISRNKNTRTKGASILLGTVGHFYRVFLGVCDGEVVIEDLFHRKNLKKKIKKLR